MDDLEEIRRRKLMELQRQKELEELQKEEMKRQYEMQKKAILRAILEPEAKERLSRVKLAHPELAEAVENQLIYLAQSGRIQSKITDEMLVEILKRVQPKKRETRIIRK
ncbi:MULTISPECIES: DNA-binding protein [unclassified Archaeoglobus]|jgi:programmed cell death protein 5|uniref:DNA-binding protein n=1 Tax=unclassified Archaeoglobus TaxID=2643606 RepID=UPI0025C65B70|nr:MULTISPECIES: DNA-binding protein [unclassified Archaeoglobus]